MVDTTLGDHYYRKLRVVIFIRVPHISPRHSSLVTTLHTSHYPHSPGLMSHTPHITLSPLTWPHVTPDLSPAIRGQSSSLGIVWSPSGNFNESRLAFRTLKVLIMQYNDIMNITLHSSLFMFNIGDGFSHSVRWGSRMGTCLAELSDKEVA